MSMQLTAGSRRPPHAMKLEIADISQKPFMQVRANRFKKKTAREVFSCDEADKNGSVLEGICKSVRNAKGRFKRERQWKAEKFRGFLFAFINLI